VPGEGMVEEVHYSSPLSQGKNVRVKTGERKADPRLFADVDLAIEMGAPLFFPPSSNISKNREELPAVGIDVSPPPSSLSDSCYGHVETR